MLHIVAVYFILTNKKDATQFVDDEIFDGLGNYYSILNINLKFRRRTLFFTFNFIVPSLIITVCTIVGFWLDSGSEEKVGLGIKLFWTFSIPKFSL